MILISRFLNPVIERGKPFFSLKAVSAILELENAVGIDGTTFKTALLAESSVLDPLAEEFVDLVAGNKEACLFGLLNLPA